MTERIYNLEDRLLEYAARVIAVVEHLGNSRAAAHVGDQLLRSGTSPYFNHGEAEAAESPRDFIHKLRICLKELRESKRALRLIQRVQLSTKTGDIQSALVETEELIRIFAASIQTVQKKLVREEGATPYGESGNEVGSTFGVGRSMFDVSELGVGGAVP